jgi:beta-phosphoglucomutase
MIRAFIFDLDGTLVQTETLKAISYARAAMELDPDNIREKEVIEKFKDVVGLSRREVATQLMTEFNLEKKARKRLDEFEVSEPWQVYVRIRLGFYDHMISEPRIIRKFTCQDTMELLEWANKQDYLTGLATMSHHDEARQIIKFLNLRPKFKFIATRDDIEHGKPDPEIYDLVAHQLKVKPEECMVIEDSSAGIKAALNALMHCVAATSDFTRRKVHESKLLDKQWIVDNPAELKQRVQKLLKQLDN